MGQYRMSNLPGDSDSDESSATEGIFPVEQKSLVRAGSVRSKVKGRSATPLVNPTSYSSSEEERVG